MIDLNLASYIQEKVEIVKKRFLEFNLYPTRFLYITSYIQEMSWKQQYPLGNNKVNFKKNNKTGY